MPLYNFCTVLCAQFSRQCLISSKIISVNQVKCIIHVTSYLNFKAAVNLMPCSVQVRLEAQLSCSSWFIMSLHVPMILWKHACNVLSLCLYLQFNLFNLQNGKNTTERIFFFSLVGCCQSCYLGVQYDAFPNASSNLQTQFNSNQNKWENRTMKIVQRYISQRADKDKKVPTCLYSQGQIITSSDNIPTRTTPPTPTLPPTSWHLPTGGYPRF